MQSAAGDLAADLDGRLRAIAERVPALTIGVSVHDYLSGRNWIFNGDKWFHSASVIKIAVLAAVHDAVQQGRFTLECRLHVRNRFRSVVDGTPFRVQASRDADAAVHAALGRTLHLRALARQMIVTSSNLATNLLLNLVGVDQARAFLERNGITGVDLRRGVEDDRAFEAGINNRMTPDGAVGLLRAVVESKVVPEHSSMEILDVLHAQQFAGTIAPGLPESIRAVARVAHKTGDISTVSHDAGVVYLPGRPPYVVAIFVQSNGSSDERVEVGAAVSAAVYDVIATAGEGVRIE